MRQTIEAVVLLAAMLIAASGVSSAAPLFVSVQDLHLLPSGQGELRLLISGDNDPLSLIGYELRITPQPGTTSQLRFVEESEDFLGDGNYLFAGNSAAAADGLASSVGTVSTTVLPSDTFIGGDGAADFGNVHIGAARLLVALPVLHDAGPADPTTTLGHRFDVTLVPLTGQSSDFAQGTANTGAIDNAFTAIPFEGHSGVVTIAIPEPATAALVVCVPLALLARRHRGRP